MRHATTRASRVAAGADLYELNPASRLDPGSGRPDHAAIPQPVRNAEAANLALDILGLGPVPGSLFNAGQDLALAPPERTDDVQGAFVDKQSRPRPPGENE